MWQEHRTGSRWCPYWNCPRQGSYLISDPILRCSLPWPCFTEAHHFITSCLYFVTRRPGMMRSCLTGTDARIYEEQRPHLQQSFYKGPGRGSWGLQKGCPTSKKDLFLIIYRKRLHLSPAKHLDGSTKGPVSRIQSPYPESRQFKTLCEEAVSLCAICAAGHTESLHI